MKHFATAGILLALFGCGSGGTTDRVAVSEGGLATAEAVVAGAPDPGGSLSLCA